MTTHILTHFHKRRSGVTTHVEDLVVALNAMHRTAFAVGEALRPDVPQIPRAEVRSILENGSPVTWHAHRPHSLREGLRLRKRWPHLRVLWTHHSWKTPGWHTTRMLRQADGIVSLTQEGATQLSMDSTVIGHGVPLDTLKPTPFPVEPRLGVIGRIRPDKGHLSVAESFAELQATAPSWRLCFFGETRPQHLRFENTLRRLLPEVLQVHGYETDRAAMYASLSGVIMPSPAEGFSLVVAEALAAGLPIIVARLPHFERCLREGESALFFDPSTPGDLSRALNTFLQDPALRDTLRVHGRSAAEKHFSIEKEAVAIASFYDQLLSQPHSF